MQSKGKDLILKLGIGFLSFMLVVMFLYVISSFYQAGEIYTHSEDSLLGNIERGQYGNLVSNVYDNEICNVKVTANMAECYAVAHYFEAASFYKVYLQNGYTEKAEEKKKIMEEQKQFMGDLAYTVEEIDEKLGLGD